MKYILLICNGQKESAAFIRSRAARADFIICADGGADAALDAEVVPDLIVGDLDSLSARAKKLKSADFLRVPRQDNTDFEKALDFILTQKIKTVRVICALGGREDFALANLLSALNYADKKEIIFETENLEIHALKKSKTFACKKNKRVSLLAPSGARGVTLSGLKYPLKNAVLAPGGRALSNITTARKFTVKLTSGSVLVYQEK